MFAAASVLGQAVDQVPYSSATISGRGARNIGWATMSGRVSAIAGQHEPDGKITLFVGAASGGVRPDLPERVGIRHGKIVETEDGINGRGRIESLARGGRFAIALSRRGVQNAGQS